MAELLSRRRAIVAALAVGLLWGLWHTGPAFWAGVLRSDWSVASIPLDCTLGTIPMTVVMAWMFVKTKSRLVPGMLFHACYNSTFFFLTQIWTPGRPVVSIPEWLAATFALALVVLVAARRTLFALPWAPDAAPRGEASG